MVRDTLLGFPSHSLPYRYRKYTTLSTVLLFIIFYFYFATKPILRWTLLRVLLAR